ncbi:MAG: family efflux pump rane fusion lipoprotein, partial [Verrucomicrobiales bacterium]|nr:family efflux pump rane fusion lipoprotein [Verrucomicrobiales bacterium]
MKHFLILNGNLGYWVSLAAALALTASCSKNKSSADAKKGTAVAPVPVVIGKAIERSMPVQIRGIGNVQAYSIVTIRSQITGQITKVHFREGQEVNAGDALFTIDQRPFAGKLQEASANLARDEAQMQNARLEFDREKKLLASSLISQDEYDKADAVLKALQATVLATRASVSNAMLNLEFTTIRSPITGRTGNLLVHKGNIVKAPDDSLLTINQVHPIYVSFSVPEQNLPEIRRRMQETKLSVEAKYPNLAAKPPLGELSFIDNAVDPTTGTIQLKATFQNVDNVLWPGQFVQTTLLLAEESKSVVVPSEAIQNGQSGSFLFVVKPDDTVEIRDVVPGIVEDGQTALLSGVKAGETV